MDQAVVFITIGLALVLFAWGRLRHDVVAVLCLLILVVAGVVRPTDAFDGFGNPAVISVAAVLVVSRGLQKTGFVEIIGKGLLRLGKALMLQILVLSVLVCVTSAFMNNIGALAIFLPVAIHITRKAGHSPSYALMPLAFASLLGGMVTMIGTPPNLIIAAYRREAVGSAFGMFDFAPVGTGIALAGIVFIVLLGWRILPKRKGEGSSEGRFNIEAYMTEVVVPQESMLIGVPVSGVGLATETGVRVLSLVRDPERPERHRAMSRLLTVLGPVSRAIGRRRSASQPAFDQDLQAGDVLVLQADSADLREFIRRSKARFAGDPQEADNGDRRREMVTAEVVVLPDSPLVKRTTAEVRLRARYGVSLLAVARREGAAVRRMGEVEFHAGDVLLVRGPAGMLDERIAAMQCIPLADRGLSLEQPAKIVLALSIFAASIVLVVTGALPVQVSFVLAALAMIVTGVIPLDDLYTAIDWPVIILLGAMLPVGAALEATGGVATITSAVLPAAAGRPEWVAITVVVVVTMLLSAVVNNAATVVLMAPVGIGIASGLGASVDPFLMAIAVGASCSFLTPVAHQSNTLVMGPGGYRFIDYVRLGLPLSVVAAAAAVPLILLVWPL